MRRLLAILVCFAAGLLLGLFPIRERESKANVAAAPSSQPAPGDAAASGDTSPHGTAPATGGKDAAVAPPSPSHPPVPPQPAPTRRVDAATKLFEQALAALPPGPTRDSSSTITARVRTPSGAPVGGVEVSITCQVESGYFHEWEGHEGNRRKGLPADLTETARRARDVGTRSYSAVSDAGGTATFTGLPAQGEFEFPEPATSNGWTLWRPKIMGEDVRAGGTFSVIADRIRRCTIDIQLSDGSTPKRATLDLRAHLTSNYLGPAWTPENRVIEIPESTTEVSASMWADGSGNLKSDTLYFFAPECPISDHITLTIHLPPAPKRGIEGGVQALMNGDKPGEAKVYAVRSTSDTPPVLDDFKLDWAPWADNRGVESRVTDAKYRLSLEPGRYAVVVVQFGRIVAHAFADVRDGFTHLDLIAVQDPSSYVDVTVLGPNGAALTQPKFIAEYPTDTRYENKSAEAALQPDGSWRVFLPEPGERAAGPAAQVGVLHSEYGAAWAVVPTGSNRQVTLRFTAPARLVVKLADFDKCRWPKQLTPYPWQKMADGSLLPTEYDKSKVGEGDRRVFSPMQPGTHVVQVMLQCDGGARFLTLSEATVALKPGDNEVTLTVPPLYSLVVKPFEGRWLAALIVESCAFSRGAATFQTDWTESKEQLLEAVPAGDYLLTPYHAPEQGSMRISVRGDTLVEFVPDPATALVVREVEPGSSVAAAGLLQLDLLVGVDGAEFSGPQDLKERFYSGQSAEVAIMVRRGDRKLEVKIARTDLMAALATKKLTVTPTVR